MQSVIVEPNKYTWFGYKVRQAGPLRLLLRAELPVTTYILSPYDLQRFSSAQPFNYQAGFPDPREFQNQTVYLPVAGEWFLVIANPNMTAVVVNFEVMY